ncbi:hypothetical protein KAR52_01195 [Candidatus Pacearchaeota archaeon]|nr:hypothetical protein [Candidatus Pacearchaeota archaeon]
MAKKEKKEVDKKTKSNTLGIAGFTLGITSLVLLLFTPFVGILTSIVGFIFCILQQKRNPTKFGKRGIIINVIGFVSNIVWWVLLVKVVYSYFLKQFPI